MSNNQLMALLLSHPSNSLSLVIAYLDHGDDLGDYMAEFEYGMAETFQAELSLLIGKSLSEMLTSRGFDNNDIRELYNNYLTTTR